MVSLDEVVLSGNKYRLAHDSLLPRGKRAWSRTIRSADIADPGTIKTARWEIASPIGDSREDLASGHLGTDWTENLDGSNFQLLTGTAESSTISLTTAISVQYALPDSTLSISGNWAETNPGGTDGNAEDEIGNGIEGGTPDDTTFWSVNASGPSHQLNVGLSNVTDPGVDTGHVIRFRAKHTHASLGRITIQLRQDSDVVYATAPYLTDSIGDYEIEVPETRIADITDYTDLNFSIRMYSGSWQGR